ncbi:MAG: M3 family oligoendopeptidase [Campylobacterales bacterium]|nr:M3 family oligoendopeptidase [Campylobacterales bacterium]
MNWNLNHLFNSIDEVDKLLEQTLVLANSFNQTYCNNLANIKVEKFDAVVKEYEAIQENVGRIMTYVYLIFATNSTKGDLLSKYQKLCTNIEELLIFFELEFNKIDEKTQQQIIKESKNYSYYLESIFLDKPYQLSDKEEKILLKKDLTSSSAFSRLFDEHLSRVEFFYDGKKSSEEEILSKLYDNSRDVRKKAQISLTKGLSKHVELFAYIFNMIKSDLKLECEFRGYDSPETPRHISNKVTKKSVDTLINTTLSSANIVSRYYKSKAKLIGLKKLKDYDRYAPIKGAEDVYDFEKSKNIVLSAFKNFDERFYNIALKAFHEEWCDVYPSDKKRGGAFSHPAVTSVHPYVLLNHTDQRRDLFTLDHELVHAIHQYLSREVGYINSDTPLTTAETASIFAEMVTFDYLYKQLPNDEKIALLGSKLEDIFATLYRQIIFTTFERRVHEKEDELKADEISQIWFEENKKMFGESVELTENYKIWWSYIPHFIHSPFYCYAYSYGQLLVLALYGLSKKNIENFNDTYIKFLSFGGSKSPKELVSMFGFDIDDENFWKEGILEIEKLVIEFENLIKDRK